MRERYRSDPEFRERLREAQWRRLWPWQTAIHNPYKGVRSERVERG